MTEEVAPRTIKMIALTEAARRLKLNGIGIGYANAYDYMLRGRLKGRKMKYRGGRKGWYVTLASVELLQAEFDRTRN